MAAAAQVKQFAKNNGMKVDSKHGVPTLQKAFPAGAIWIECFDSWGQAAAFIDKAKSDYERHGKARPWDAPNLK